MPPEDITILPEPARLIDWSAFEAARSELGAEFLRILGYFREDGYKSVARIEHAVRAMDSVAIVIPAHTLKGEASQFGAEPLADLAERIEEAARICVEHRDTPEDLIADAARLRPLFEASLEALERESNPLVERRRARAVDAVPGFGRG